MELLLRIRWRAIPVDDIRVDIEATHTVADLLSAANAWCGGGWEPSQPVYLERTGAVLPLTDLVVDHGIVSGDTLRFEMFGVDSSAWSAPSQAISCDIVAGPEAGRSVVLKPGSHGVGRAQGNTVALDDPHVSEAHFTVAVGDDLSTMITPVPGVINPVLVNGVPADGATRVGPDDVIQFGATAVALRVFARAIDSGRDQLGQVSFNRTPYRPSVVTERTFKPLGNIPMAPEPRRFAVLGAILPLGSGLLLFAFSGQPQFLALTLLSPISLIGNWFEDRRTGRYKYARDRVSFSDRLTRRVDELRMAAQQERTERLHQAPDLADLARRANLRTLDLWARQRDDDDFLLVRLGLGSVASKISVEPDTNGDADLLEFAEASSHGYDRIAASPVCADLAEFGVVGLHGAPMDVQGLVSSLIVQAVTLHSPEDLVLVTIEGDDDQLSTWTKWLPHTRSATSPMAGSHVVSSPETAAEAVRELVSVARRRTSTEDRSDRNDKRWPWVLVVLDESANADPALVSQLLDLCPAAGISVIATAGSETRVPRQASAVVQCNPMVGGALSMIWFADPELETQQFEPEIASARLTDRVALALAPLRDATAATATSSIPRTVPLLTLFGAEPPTPTSVAATWAEAKPYGLAAPIGTGPNGPLVLDLVEHGPHALIGGTSGAGKSELLQSIVASLVSQYPPTRLTFLFVDYKGGASSTVFSGIPHTVGYVTNLEASLALRALTSLRAELNHRMRLMEGRAKDLAEMLEKHPADAPPSLVIVVDEFATLVKEVPDFVAGIVDIAQRGRSLGIHLILATQRPSGSVNDNILANTNLRISLRMLDNQESNSVIGVSAAADIPVPLKGRGYARLGPRDITEFQSAFTGAPFGESDAMAAVHCSFLGARSRRRHSTSTFDAPRPTAAAVSVAPPPPNATVVVNPSAGPALTHLDVLLNAVAEAMPNLPPARRPWRETLPELIVLDELRREVPLPTGSAIGRDVLVGLTDDPAVQNQYPTVLNLEDGGGLLVVGSAGSGKTTVLRTVAASAVAGATTEQVTLFVLDCASRSLQVLRDLPHCASVATGDDLEGLTRTIVLLETERERRRLLLSALDVQAETLTAYVDQRGAAGSDDPLPRIIVLVDGYQNLSSILNSSAVQQLGASDWIGMFHRLITDGRQVGIHVVVSADRRQAIPALMMSAVSTRLVLRQTDETSYSDFGVPTSISRGLELPGGRAILDGLMVQIASVSADPLGAEQGAALRSLAATLDGDTPAALRTWPPQESVSVPPPTRALVANIGRVDVSQAVATVDLEHAGMCVAGSLRSGRTTALRQVARSLIAGGAEVWTVGLGDLGGAGSHASTRTDDVARLFTELAVLCESLDGEQPRVLVVDNVDRIEDTAVLDAYGRIKKTETIRLVGSIEERNFSPYTMSQLLLDLRREPNLLLLQPDSAADVLALTGVRAPFRPGLKMSSGRGILLVDRIPQIVQVAQRNEA